MPTKSKPEVTDVSGRPSIKQVIDGKAYNTETANFIHEYIRDDDNDWPEDPRYPYSEQMFRTRFGKFFLVVRNESFFNPANDEADMRDRVIPLNRTKPSSGWKNTVILRLLTMLMYPKLEIQALL